MDNKADILFEEKELITINGKEFYIGKLTLSQTWKIAKFLTEIFFSSQQKVKEYQEKIKNSDSNIQDFMTIFDMIGDENALKFYQILLNENDINFLKNHLDFTKSIEIINILFKYNDPEVIKKNFLLLWNHIQKMIQTEKT